MVQSEFKINGFTWIYDNRNPESVSNKLRRRRLKLLVSWLKNEVVNFNSDSVFSILDLGGTELFWMIHGSYIQKQVGKSLFVTILNKDVNDSQRLDFEKIRMVTQKGDARNLMGFSSNHFDLVFSNSVIEHVGNLNDQQQIAGEIKRVGKIHFIQTPNPWFPIEPHFHFPFWPFLNEVVQVWLLTHFSLGWYEKFQSREEAVKEIRAVNLIPLKRFRTLFPESEIIQERVLGLSKSFIALGKGVE